MPRRVSVVPHTHWDREWHAPFQTLRIRLVDVLDRLLVELDADPSFAHFMLDGQMAVVDDYLEVRPDAASAIRRHVDAGRVSIGPWYVLMDEFLVSAETVIRNLQLGLATAARLGGAMEVGYLPDMFGHIAQMPQILRQAGMEHAVVWRGVPSAVDRTGFWWTAPDGSTVRAEYLPTGYSNGVNLPDSADEAAERLRIYEEEVGGFLLGDLLYLNGTDHEAPQPGLGRLVAEVNDLQRGWRLEITSLAAHLERAPTEGLPSWTGELRSGARTHVLRGVASNRVDIKQVAAATERALERLAEPLSALLLPADRYPTVLLDLAWREVIRSSAHDSICGCSVDEVGAAVLHRYAEARQIADGLTERALAALASSAPTGAVVVLNPSARPRGGVVEVVASGAEPGAGEQVLASTPALSSDVTIPARELGAFLGRIRGQQLDGESYVDDITVTDTVDGFEVTIDADCVERSNPAVDQAKRLLYSRAKVEPGARVRVRVRQPPWRRSVVRVEGAPGFGWAPIDLAPPDRPVRVDGLMMANGLASLVVDSGDGTFSLDGLAGLGRLVDDGDHGDTYTWSPPDHDLVVDAPDACDVTVVESGPVRGVVEVRRRYRWPERVDEVSRSRGGEVPVDVLTTYTLGAGEPFVRVRHDLVNRCRDHRLRVWFPLASRAVMSRAECAFGIVQRGLDTEGGPMERGVPTFPSRRFVQVGDLTIAHEGLLEYEVVDDGSALALTLLRATGMLSRPDLTYRPVAAGPAIVTEASQVLGARTASYVVARGAVDPYALVDDAFLRLLLVQGTGDPGLDASGQALSVEGAEVSSVRRVDGVLEVRVFNPSADATTVRMPGRRGTVVDLRGAVVGEFDGTLRLDPWRFATIRLTD